jgi:hypothetical protein
MKNAPKNPRACDVRDVLGQQRQGNAEIAQRMADLRARQAADTQRTADFANMLARPTKITRIGPK